MPLVGPAIKQQAEAQLLTAFAREFKDVYAANPGAAADHKKMAAAISDIILTIVTAIQTQAQVAPGIPVATAGSPAAQTGATVAPGMIL